jgi:hypothetical protein
MLGHMTVGAQSATEVKVLEKVRQGYRVQNRHSKKNPIA